MGRTPREELDDLVDAIRSRKFDYEAPEPQPFDWARYTKAQVHEINDVLRLIRRGVNAQEEPPPRSGVGRRHEHTARDLTKAVLLQQYLGTSNRVTEGWCLLFEEKLRLDRVPNYKAIERAYEDERVIAMLRGVFGDTARMGAEQAEGFAADGSALPRSRKANWESDKRRRSESKRSKKKGASKKTKAADAQSKAERAAAHAKTYDGAVGMVTVPGHIWVGHVPHPVGRGSESPTLDPLIDQVTRRLGSLWGPVRLDAAFIARENCTRIDDAGGVPRIFPKRGLTLLAKGHPAWRRMLLAFLEDTQTWLREFYGRNSGEAGWGTHKHRHPPLRRKRARRLATERATRFVTDNLVSLARLHRMRRLSVAWMTGPLT